MDDLLGLFGGAGGQVNAGTNAFGGENVWGDLGQQNGSDQSASGKSKTNEDILGLF